MAKSSKVIRAITINALIAAIYVVLSLALGSFSFGTNGFIDFRISETLMMFAFISPMYFPGLIIGCFVTNIFSGMAIDLLIGTLQTAIACVIMYLLRRFKHLALFLAALTCGVMIGLELYFLGFSSMGLLIIVSVLVSEFIVLEIGYCIFIVIFKSNKFSFEQTKVNKKTNKLILKR